MALSKGNPVAKVIIGTVALSMILSSCAYFNTLYNARKLYDEAERDRQSGREERGLREKYMEIVKKCATLVRDYPESRWVDDAIFLMGQALVRQGELGKGIRKFMELTTNFPGSDYVPKSYYWLAYAYHERGEYNQALVYVDRFMRAYPNHGYRPQVLFVAGDINRALQNQEQALHYYGMAAEESGKREDVEEAIMRSAELYYAAQQWDDAVTSYERLLRKGLKWNRRLMISLRLGDCYTKTGRCLDALDLYGRLLEDVPTNKERPEILLGQASGYLCADSLDRALGTYKYITREFPKSAFSAEAFYNMGVIYQEKLDSLTLARDAFSKVGGEYAGSEFAAVSLQRSNSLKRLIELSESGTERSGVDQLAEKRLMAAEIQLTRLGKTGSALQNYEAVLDSFPSSSSAPKAAYAVAYIQHRQLDDTTAAVETYRRLVTGYPRTPQAMGAIEQLSLLGRGDLVPALRSYIDSALADTTALEVERTSPADTAIPGGAAVPAGETPLDSLQTAPSATVRAAPPDSVIPPAARSEPDTSLPITLPVRTDSTSTEGAPAAADSAKAAASSGKQEGG